MRIKYFKTQSLLNMKRVIKFIFLITIILFSACKNNKDAFDATGTFEADEIIVSAEANGKILRLDAEEGSLLKKDSIVGNIDPSTIELQKEQAVSSVDALTQKTNNAAPQINILQSQMESQIKQIAVQEEQLKTLKKDQQRYKNLVASASIPAKQLDDITGQVNVLEKQIAVSKSQVAVLQSQVNSQRQSVAIQNRSILSEKDPMQKRVAQIQDQLNKTKIVNPINGTVLTKYAAANEYTYPPLWGEASYTTGAGLYRISRLAGYVKHNMPFTLLKDEAALTDEEAWDVAAFINSQPRPQKNYSKDWPDISSKPFDHPFGPYADNFTETQHKYGPFGPMKKTRK